MIPFDDYTSVAYLLQNCLLFQQASVVQISAICDYSAEHTNKLAQGHTQCCLNTSCLPNLFFSPKCFTLLTHQIPQSKQAEVLPTLVKIRYVHSVTVSQFPEPLMPLFPFMPLSHTFRQQQSIMHFNPCFHQFLFLPITTFICISSHPNNKTRHYLYKKRHRLQ